MSRPCVCGGSNENCRYRNGGLDDTHGLARGLPGRHKIGTACRLSDETFILNSLLIEPRRPGL
jgi:hypothetical protein